VKRWFGEEGERKRGRMERSLVMKERRRGGEEERWRGGEGDLGSWNERQGNRSTAGQSRAEQGRAEQHNTTVQYST